ncbi:MAG TPA: hypothetical protein PK413_13115, partial [Thermoanaerobaculia bacterium]|nr:hypothetical protein [Thermoanaerobaculia bacterium]
MTSIERGSLFAAACLLLGSTAWANPNTLRRGQSVLTVSGASWSFDRFLVGNGDTDKLPVTITQTSFILGFDHGLSDQLQLSVNVPWVSSKRDVVDTVRGGRRVDPGDASTNDGAGDARLSLKYRLTHGTGPQVALYLGAKWPGSYRTRIVPSNQRGRGEVDLINSPGDGNFDLEAGASVGHQWGPFTGSVDLGYRLRQGLPPNEYVLRL